MESIRDDGTLDYKSYADELYKFYEIVTRNPDQNMNWEIKKFYNDLGGLVLISKSLVKVNEKSENEKSENEKSENEKSENVIEDEQFEETDDKECKIESDQNLISIEHHIVYSISYSVPVLYFKSCYLNGKSLTIDEIWKLIPKFCNQLKNELNEDQLITMITQFEHPILQRPFFAVMCDSSQNFLNLVHPCKTSELMSNLIKSFDRTKMNYILSWLSTIGPICGLKLGNLKI